MSTSIGDQMEQAIADLRVQQERIRVFQQELSEMSVTVLSKNRMVEATVDSGGKLTLLAFKGNRYRNLPAAELGALVVETVAKAQTEAQTATMAKAAALMPGGLRMPDFGSEDFDLAQVFDSAIAQAGLPLPQGEGKGTAP
jgi:DNA-binding protein YbaB